MSFTLKFFFSIHKLLIRKFLGSNNDDFGLRQNGESINVNLIEKQYVQYVVAFFLAAAGVSRE